MGTVNIDVSSDSSSSGTPAAHSLCDGLTGSYSIAFHIGGCLIILFASALGCAMPILTKYVESLRSNPFVFIVGKTAATGVLLSVSTIHLINEGTVAFHEPCVVPFFKSYSAFSFLFALMAVLLMQALDLKLAEVAEGWVRAQHATEVTIESGSAPSDDGKQPQIPCTRAAVEEDERHAADEEISPRCKAVAVHDQAHHGCAGHSHDNHGAEVHGHQHLSVLPPEEMGHVRRVIAAVCMEFGVALHSIFVGIAVGLTTDAELKPLLVALIFHQSFEGMAMGSRLVDASFNRRLETVLALVFVLSAPLGMLAAIIAVSVSRDAMSGGKFVTMMATLDSFCGGILLYLAFTLLLGDFVSDLKEFASAGVEGSGKRKAIMYAALWIGMLMMAAVGNWL